VSIWLQFCQRRRLRQPGLYCIRGQGQCRYCTRDTQLLAFRVHCTVLKACSVTRFYPQNLKAADFASVCPSVGDPRHLGVDPDPQIRISADPNPTPDVTPFFSGSKDAKKKISYFFSFNFPAVTLSSVLKI
jgi:hypothetical protein